MYFTDRKDEATTGSKAAVVEIIKESLLSSTGQTWISGKATSFQTFKDMTDRYHQQKLIIEQNLQG